MTASRSPRSVALAIFRLAPAGGLEQHCLRLAEALTRRGCAVTLVTTRPPASALAGVAVEIVAARGRTNHGRIAAFAADAKRAVAGRFDRTVTFDAAPGFDFFFCAHPSRGRPGPLQALAPRYRAFARLEHGALAPAAATRVFCLSTAQLDGLALNHGTPRERLLLLPPTVERPTAADPAAARSPSEAGERVLLWMGLQARTKGLDRALAALAATPHARLVVCGLDPQGRAGGSMRRLSLRLGVGPQVGWLGFVGEAERRAAMAGADLLIHPSREDVTGTVILEAMAAGLPVITTAVCGYAEHVRRADAGVVLAEPFRAANLVAALAQATPERLRRWSEHALAYTRRDELYSGLERAADLIVELRPLARAPGMP